MTLVCGTAGFDGTQFKGLLAAKYNIQLNKTSRNSVLVQTNINNTRSDVALPDQGARSRSRSEIEAGSPRAARAERAAFAARVKSLMEDVPDLPNFSRFHDGYPRESGAASRSKATCARAFFAAYEEDDCEYMPLIEPEDRRAAEERPGDGVGQLRHPLSARLPDHGAGPGDRRRRRSASCASSMSRRSTATTTRAASSCSSRDAHRPPSRRERLQRPTGPGESTMQAIFHCLAANPYILLFARSASPCWLGRSDGRGLRPRHGRLGDHRRLRPVGLGVDLRREARAQQLHASRSSTTCSCTASGLRVGPSFINSLRRRRPQVHRPRRRLLRRSGLALVVVGAKLFDLPTGAAGGMLAGSQTMSAAIGSAEQAVLAGAVTPPPAQTPEQVSGHDRARPTASPTSGAPSASS